MNRNFGIGILIACFGLSSVNVSLAAEIVAISPIIVQPYDLNALSQQMLEQDRMNRDQELAIKGLIDDNQRMIDMDLARHQDVTLDKIDETMTKYRDFLIARDKARIEANSQRTIRYNELINLTKDVNDNKDIGDALKLKTDVIEEKYKMLNDLKNEMVILNGKLKAQAPPKDFDKLTQQQDAKIQILTQRLAEMDQKVSHYDEILAQKDQQITQLKGQLGLLKSELEDKITEENDQGQKDEIIKKQGDQIAVLKAQSQELTSKEESSSSQIMDLKNKVQGQSNDLKARDGSIDWLNKVLAATKDKAKYYQLTVEQNQSSMQQLQGEVQKIKDDFAQHFQDYAQFENAIASLKGQVGQLGIQLSEKQQEAGILKAQLESKTTQSNNQEDQIVRMRSDIAAILQERAKKEIYLHNETLQRDDRVKLAQQLIDLQRQETVLLDEKNKLEADQNAIFEKQAQSLGKKINDLITKHQIQDQDTKNSLDELKSELDQKEQQVSSLKKMLEDKIAEEKNQDVLLDQIQDLKTQLQDKDGQMATMRLEIQSGKETQGQVDALKQQLSQQQAETDALKKQLDSKNAQSEKMTGLMGDYQKKLESKDNAYNDELKQVEELSAQLQDREAEVVKIKKDIYDLQESAVAKETDAQAHDLSQAMVQQKMMDVKIKEYQDKVNELQAANDDQAQEVKNLKVELALARQKLASVPSSDEIEFLRTGIQKATAELKQKDDQMLKIKSNADEYTKEFKKQTREFQSLTEQLLDAREQIDHKDEDLKYKGMEITRLKLQLKMGAGDLQKQVILLTQKLELTQKQLRSKTHENKIEALQAQLMDANAQIKDLKSQLDQFKSPFRDDPYEQKLKQALDKIDQQGQEINALAQKLEDAGQTVDLVHNNGK